MRFAHAGEDAGAPSQAGILYELFRGNDKKTGMTVDIEQGRYRLLPAWPGASIRLANESANPFRRRRRRAHGPARDATPGIVIPLERSIEIGDAGDIGGRSGEVGGMTARAT